MTSIPGPRTSTLVQSIQPQETAGDVPTAVPAASIAFESTIAGVDRATAVSPEHPRPALDHTQPSNEDSSATDVDDEEEPEPQLKYERLGGDVAEAFKGAYGSVLCSSSKALVLGTSAGNLHLLDYSGNQVRRFPAHKAKVTALSFDEPAEYLGSASQDGTVSVRCLYSEEQLVSHNFKEPITALALDPRYGSRKTREFITGSAAGALTLSSQGWLGRSDHVIHTGEGRIHALQWVGTTVAWCNELGVRVYDTTVHQKLGRIDRPRGKGAVAAAPCTSLLLEGESSLLAAWPDCIKIAKIEQKAEAGVARMVSVVRQLMTDFYVLGLAPCGAEGLAVLTYAGGELAEGVGREGSQPKLAENGTSSSHAAPATESASGEAVITAPAADTAAASSVQGPVAGPAPDAAPAAPDGGPPWPGLWLRLRGSSQSESGPTSADLVVAGTASQPAAASTHPAHPTSNGDTIVSVPPSTKAPHTAPNDTTAASEVGQASPSGRTTVSPPAPEAAAVAPTPVAAVSRSPMAANGKAVAQPKGATAGSSPELMPPSSPSQTAAVTAAAPSPSPPSTPAAATASTTLGHTSQQAPGTPPSTATTTPSKQAAGVLAAPASPASPQTSKGDTGTAAAVSATGTSGAALELRMLSRTTWAERSVDVLPLEFDPAHSSDYALISTHAAAADGDGGYFVLAPQDILWGKLRDSDDRIVWMLEHNRYEKALELVEADRSIQRSGRDAVCAAWLEHLTANNQWAEAAALCPRLLLDSATLWERWVYTFAQARHLALLAPLLPTGNPRLRPTAYELVLQSLLLGPPAHHQLLLTVLRDWPTHLYSGPTIIEAINNRVRRSGGDSPLLWNVLAVVYQQQGRPDLALAIQLQMRSVAVFDFIRRQGPAPSLTGKAALLMEIDEDEALALLVEFHELLPASRVVPTLQDAISQAGMQGGEAAARLWRLRLHKYLQALFAVDPMAGTEFHTLQVTMYSEFQPEGLMAFLAASQHYSLEAALQVAESKGLLREAVYILGRMGNAHRALALLIEKLADIPAAIEFVRSQQDEELWDDLLSWALRSPGTVAQLLDLIGGVINPLRLIEQLPLGMEIPQLRDRLRKIISDFRTETSLREGCNNILRADCLLLINRLYHEVRHAVPGVYIPAEPAQHGSAAAGWQLYDCSKGATTAVDPAAAPSWLSAAAARRLSVADLAGPSTSTGVSATSVALPDGGPNVRLWLGAAAEAAAKERALDPEAKKTGPGRPPPASRAVPRQNLPSLVL